VVLIHEDIYADEENIGLLLHLRYIADLVIKAAPLSTGLAADVHGQVRLLILHICLSLSCTMMHYGLVGFVDLVVR
jgi:hypothetical protein